MTSPPASAAARRGLLLGAVVDTLRVLLRQRAVVEEDAHLASVPLCVLGEDLEHRGDLAQLLAVAVGVVRVQPLPRAKKGVREEDQPSAAGRRAERRGARGFEGPVTHQG